MVWEFTHKEERLRLRIDRSYIVNSGIYARMSDGDRWLVDVLDKKQKGAKQLLFYRYQILLYGIMCRYFENLDKSDRIA